MRPLHYVNTSELPIVTNVKEMVVCDTLFDVLLVFILLFMAGSLKLYSTGNL